MEESLAREPIHREFTRVVTDDTAEDNTAGLAFVSVEDVRRTTAVAPYVTALDFIVLRVDEKLLVSARPHLQAKHVNAMRELQNLFGLEYKPVRIWPSEGPDGWDWREYAIGLPGNS